MLLVGGVGWGAVGSATARVGLPQSRNDIMYIIGAGLPAPDDPGSERLQLDPPRLGAIGVFQQDVDRLVVL